MQDNEMVMISGGSSTRAWLSLLHYFDQTSITTGIIASPAGDAKFISAQVQQGVIYKGSISFADQIKRCA